MKKLIVPVNVCIKRFYRTYVMVDIDAADEEIRQVAKRMIVDEQESAIDDDPDLSIEEHDIVFVDIDHDGEWTESEGEYE